MRRAVKRYIVLLEFLIALGILPGCVWSVPTAGEKKARKRTAAKRRAITQRKAEKRAESQPSDARRVGRSVIAAINLCSRYWICSGRHL